MFRSYSLVYKWNRWIINALQVDLHNIRQKLLNVNEFIIATKIAWDVDITTIQNIRNIQNKCFLESTIMTGLFSLSDIIILKKLDADCARRKLNYRPLISSSYTVRGVNLV